MLHVNTPICTSPRSVDRSSARSRLARRVRRRRAVGACSVEARGRPGRARHGSPPGGRVPATGRCAPRDPPRAREVRSGRRDLVSALDRRPAGRSPARTVQLTQKLTNGSLQPNDARSRVADVRITILTATRRADPRFGRRADWSQSAARVAHMSYRSDNAIKGGHMPACRLRSRSEARGAPKAKRAQAPSASLVRLWLRPPPAWCWPPDDTAKRVRGHTPVRSLVLHVAARVQSPWAQRYFAAW